MTDHWLTRYDSDTGEPYGTVCSCDVGEDHKISGEPDIEEYDWEIEETPTFEVRHTKNLISIYKKGENGQERLLQQLFTFQAFDLAQEILSHVSQDLEEWRDATNV